MSSGSNYDIANVTFTQFLLVQRPIDLYFYSILTVFIMIQVALFPFYVFVYTKNRYRDKDSLVFPLVSNFYYMMYVIYILLFFKMISYFFWVSFTIEFKKSKKKLLFDFLRIRETYLFFRYLSLISDELNTVLDRAFQFLLSIMAIHKCVMYFFEDTQKYVEMSQSKMRIFIFLVYLVLLVKQTFFFVLFVICDERLPLCLKLQPMNFVNSDSLISFWFFHSFFTISAFLYIPMLISINKYSNLHSVKESRPQRYILWQTLTVLILKSTHIPYYYVIWRYGASFIGGIYFFGSIDNYSSPLAMQISYLGCNKKNVETLFGCLRFRKFLSKERTRIEATSAAQQDMRISML